MADIPPIIVRAITNPDVLFLRQALESGLDHTQTCLAEHELALGRTTRKNRMWAEHLETDITNLKIALEILKT